MTKIELVLKIGNEICEGCNDDTDGDCGLEMGECGRVANALEDLDVFLKGDSDE